MTLRHLQRSASFHDRLRRAREEAGLSQRELAERTGMYADRHGISLLELGKRGPTVRQVAKLARALGCSPASLAYGHECNSVADEPEGYGVRLREVREQAGLTQEQLRELLGYAHRSAIAALEGEARELDLALAEAAAKVLGVAPEWLAYGHRCE